MRAPPGWPAAIEKAYLLLTTECNDACRYCIVRKGTESMDARTIRDALRLVLSSPGHDKKVVLYGGEPLLRLDLVEATVRAVEDAVRAGAPRPRLFTFTNTLGLDDAALRSLDRWGVDVVVSLDACQELSPAGERSARHRETFATKVANVRRAVASLGPDRVCAASVLLPGEVDTLVPAARWLWDEVGVQTIKILPALGRYHWTLDETRRLDARLADLGRVLLERLRGKRPVFFDMVNESVVRCDRPETQGAVPVSVLEFYPDRSYGLSPCEFELPAGVENLNDTDRYRLGSLDNPGSGVLTAGALLFDSDRRHSALMGMARWSEGLASAMAARAPVDPDVARWVERARRLSFA